MPRRRRPLPPNPPSTGAAAKVFTLDVLECPSCGGRLELIAFIAEAGVAKRILDHLGLASQAPPLARARAPDDAGLDAPGHDYQAGDPTYDD